MALSKTTKDHDEIQRWAEERGGKPAHVRSTESPNDIGILRIDFPGFGQSAGSSLEEIPWEEFFEKFDEQGLALVYQEETAEGERSNFNKLISGDSVDLDEEDNAPAKSTSRGRSKRKATATGSAAKKGSAKQSGARASAAKKVVAKKTPAKKTPAKKTAAKKAAPAKAVKKGAAKKSAPVKKGVKAPAKKAAKKTAPAKKAQAKKVAAKKKTAAKTKGRR